MPEGLPAGVELYRTSPGGRLTRTTAAGALALDDDLLPFIDADQRAHYLIGDAHSGPDRPSHATVKIGLLAPHSVFTPHVHGAEHVVLSLGDAFCTLVAGRTVVPVALPPGCLLRIPALLPHAFGNRDRRPLLILAANTGLGLADDNYAVIAAEARSRAAGDPDWAVIAADLELLGGAPPPRRTARHRAASALRALAGRLDTAGPGHPR